MALDPFLMEVFRSRLDSIVEEMQSQLLKSSYSIILKEGGDCSCAILAPNCEIISQATANPTHLAAFVPAAEHVLARFPASEMADGDVYLLNDPYNGGTHTPDFIVVVPVFAPTLIALACVLAHHQDVGGKAPGSMIPDATDIIQEGLSVPPVRFYHRGERNTTLVDILSRNVRVPDQLFGDLAAQVAAGRTAVVRLREMADRYGVECFVEVVPALLDHAEVLTRKQLALIPDGSYEFTDFLDNDGVDTEIRLQIHVRVEVTGSNLHFDFTGTSAQARGPANSAPEGVLAPVYYAVRAITGADIPSNSGCFRPITVTAPAGSLLKPTWPAPVSIRYQTLKRCVDAIMGALAPVLPDRIPTAPHGNELCVSIGGVDESSAGFVYMDCTTGGTGGTWHRDGVDYIGCDLGNGMNIPAEAVEMEYPIRLWANRLRVDSGGPGKYRGGLGVVRVLELLHGSAVVSMRSDRHTTQPWGLRGGGPGARWAAIVARRGSEPMVVPGRLTFRLEAGDRLIVASGGGGGYGSPGERDAAEVVDDVRDKRVSQSVAREIYGVEMGRDGLLDYEATAEIRSMMAAQPAAELEMIDRGTDGASSLSELESELGLAKIGGER